MSGLCYEVPHTACSTTLGPLMSVVLSATVSSSAMPNVNTGDPVTISFLAESTPLYRDCMTPAGDQGPVFDGISPYKVCPKDFSIAFPSSGVTARYLPPKPPPTTTLALDPGGAGFQKPPPDKPTTTAPAPVAGNSTRNATAAPAVVVAPPPPPPPSPSLWFALMRACDTELRIARGRSEVGTPRTRLAVRTSPMAAAGAWCTTAFG